MEESVEKIKEKDLKKYIKKIKVGNVELKNNVFLAPMAGVTDIPFRKTVLPFSPGLMYTEMASTKALEFNSKKTEKILRSYGGRKTSSSSNFWK